MTLVAELDAVLSHLTAEQAATLGALMDRALTQGHDEDPGHGYPAAWGYVRGAVQVRARGAATPPEEEAVLASLAAARDAAHADLAAIHDAVWEGAL